MAGQLWETSPAWRWAVTMTVLLSGLAAICSPWTASRTTVSPVAVYTPPQPKSTIPMATQRPPPVVPATSVQVSTTSPRSLSGHNPAFDIPMLNAPQALPPGAELHLLGVYEGAPPDGEADKPWWQNCTGLQDNPSAMRECHQKYAQRRSARRIAVDVGQSAEPMVLVLMSYEPVIWKLSVSPGARLTRIYLAGYHSQDVEGAPESTTIEVRTHDTSPCQRCIRQSDYFYAYKQDSPDYHNTVAKLKAITGLNPTSFQGAYRTNRFAVGGFLSSTASRSRNPGGDDAYVGNTFKDQISVARIPVSLPEGTWRGIAHSSGPSKRGQDALVSLSRIDGADFGELISIRVQIADDRNGFPKFAGCETTPRHAGSTSANESFGMQLCYQVTHVSDAWSQPLLEKAKAYLRGKSQFPPETVIAASFHKADMKSSVDFLYYALPAFSVVQQAENWELSAWHPRRITEASSEARFVEGQVAWATTWYQLFGQPTN